MAVAVLLGIELVRVGGAAAVRMSMVVRLVKVDTVVGVCCHFFWSLSLPCSLFFPISCFCFASSDNDPFGKWEVVD